MKQFTKSARAHFVKSFTNRHELLAASRHKSKREVEKLVREWYPLPDVPATVRKLPMQAPEAAALGALQPTRTPDDALPRKSPASTEPGELVAPRIAEPAPRPSVIAPLAAERYKVQFTANAGLHDKLRRAQDLLRHRIPDGDLSQVFELALGALIERLEKQRFAATDRPRTTRGVAPCSRAIPADVKRAVWERDGGRCAFIGNGDRRCRETGFLEFHHVVPYARGGKATVTNIALRCRSHNQYEARLEFAPFDLPIVRESSPPWEVNLREPSTQCGTTMRQSNMGQGVGPVAELTS